MDYDPTLSNKEFSQKISVLGIKRANEKLWQMFVLGILAGLYIGFGGQVCLVALEQGQGRIVAGTVFGIGLVLVVIAGAELFTGNIILTVGAVTRQFPFSRLLKNWVTVYLGNFAGAYALALAVWYGGLLGSSGGLNSLGQLAATVAQSKIGLTFGECVLRGILCNILVLLAIILATMAKDIVSKIICCILPIMVFVACGFEHCVANMYLIAVGLMAKGMTLPEQMVMFNNLIPVTLGNIIGGICILFLHPNRIRQLKYLHQSAPVPKG